MKGLATNLLTQKRDVPYNPRNFVGIALLYNMSPKKEQMTGAICGTLLNVSYLLRDKHKRCVIC